MFDITYTVSVAGQNGGGNTTDSGTVVTNKTTNAHAGWPISVGAILRPGDTGWTISFAWTVSGSLGSPPTAIKNYSVTPPTIPFYNAQAAGEGFTGTQASGTTGKVIILAAADLLQQQPPKFFFVDNSNHTVSCVASFGNQSAKAQTNFIVNKPSVPLTTETYQGGTALYEFNGEIYFGLMGPNNTAGIEFNAPSIPSGYSGSLKWIQIYSAHRTEQYYNGNYYTDFGAGLDTTFPYEAVFSNGSPYDAPDSSWSSTAFYTVELATVRDSATMWMMYQPGYAGSLMVPLDNVAWDWGGACGSEPAGKPFTSGDYNSVDPVGVATNDYPEWTDFASITETLSSESRPSPASPPRQRLQLKKTSRLVGLSGAVLMGLVPHACLPTAFCAAEPPLNIRFLPPPGPTKSLQMPGAIRINPPGRVKVKLGAAANPSIPGAGPFLRESFINVGRANAAIGFTDPDAAVLQSYQISGPAGNVRPTRLSRWWPAGYRLHALGARLAFKTVCAGSHFNRPNLLRPWLFGDMTLPGKYRIRTNTGRGQPPSNVLTLSVLAASPVVQAITLLVPGAGVHTRNQLWGKPWHGIAVLLQRAPEAKGTARGATPSLRVLIRNTGLRLRKVVLSGLATADFRKLRVRGPTGVYINARTAEHMTLTNTSPPLTAYGKTLAAHRAPALPTTRYTLRPGGMYEYTQVLLPMATRDLSLPGKYRVSVRLRGTHSWSNVVTVDANWGTRGDYEFQPRKLPATTINNRPAPKGR
ncbi:MAG: hypothetical protein HKL96_05775 [Phycisphaerales bacterium]|nr:hypothetical protein [Phycisphaerales bacterium]